MIGSRTALIALILATSSALAGAAPNAPISIKGGFSQAKGAERLTVGI
jgi:hypothetical protein